MLGAAGNGTGPSTAYGGAPRGRILALLPEEPAGRISTRNAGAISFRVTLKKRPGEVIPSGPILGDPSPGARFYSLILAYDPASATRQISCEIRALYDEQLTAALDSALRSVTAHAALAEAVLETRAVRLAGPSETPASLVKELVQRMSGAGLRTTLGPSWIPAPDADVSVGTRGLEETFDAFLQEAHPVWRPSPPGSAAMRPDALCPERWRQQRGSTGLGAARQSPQRPGDLCKHTTLGDRTKLGDVVPANMVG